MVIIYLPFIKHTRKYKETDMKVGHILNVPFLLGTA